MTGKRNPEGKEQVAKRQAKIKARRKAQGRVRLELWPLAEHAEAIRQYAMSLERPPHRPGVLIPSSSGQ